MYALNPARHVPYVGETVADVKLIIAREEADEAERGRIPFGAVPVTESSFILAGFDLEEQQ